VTKVTRLVAGIAAVIAGTATALAGTRLAWHVFVTPGRVVETGDGPFRFPDTRSSVIGASVVDNATAVAALALVAAALALLAGPRARLAFLAMATLADAYLFASASSSAVLYDLAEGVRLEDGPSRELIAAGSLAAVLAGLWAFPVAGKVRRLRMPEASEDERALAD
jgi:hypothetical protein